MNTECCGTTWGNDLIKHLKEPIRHWRKDPLTKLSDGCAEK